MGRLRTAFVCIVVCLSCVNCGIIAIEEHYITYYADGIVEKIPDSTADYGLRGTLEKKDGTKKIVEGKYRFAKNSRYNSPLYNDSLIKFTCDVYSEGIDDWKTVISEIITLPAM